MDESSSRTVTFQRSQSDYITAAAAAAAAVAGDSEPSSPSFRRWHSSTNSSSEIEQQQQRRQSSIHGGGTIADAGTVVSPSSASRRRSLHYDASHAMDRLRSTFIADYPQEGLHLPDLATTNHKNYAIHNNNSTTNQHLSSTISSTFSADSLDSVNHHIIINNNTHGSNNSIYDSERQQHPFNLTRMSHRSSAANSDIKQQQQAEWAQFFRDGLGQVPAVALIAVFHLMIGIPFGVS